MVINSFQNAKCLVKKQMFLGFPEALAKYHSCCILLIKADFRASQDLEGSLHKGEGIGSLVNWLITKVAVYTTFQSNIYFQSYYHLHIN